MKYVKKLPGIDHELSDKLCNDGWKKLKEPGSSISAVLLSVPFMFLLDGVTMWISYLLKPELFNFLQSDGLSLTINLNLEALLFAAALLIYMFIHEMLHALCIPNFINSDKTCWGLNGLFGFVFTTEPLTKGRFLLVACMPFLILSPAAIFIFYLTGMLNTFTLLLILINAAGSCVDFLNILLIIVQVERGSVIINNGFETYFTPIN